MMLLWQRVKHHVLTDLKLYFNEKYKILQARGLCPLPTVTSLNSAVSPQI